MEKSRGLETIANKKEKKKKKKMLYRGRDPRVEVTRGMSKQKEDRRIKIG